MPRKQKLRVPRPLSSNIVRVRTDSIENVVTSFTQSKERELYIMTKLDLIIAYKRSVYTIVYLPYLFEFYVGLIRITIFIEQKFAGTSFRTSSEQLLMLKSISIIYLCYCSFKTMLLVSVIIIIVSWSLVLIILIIYEFVIVSCFNLNLCINEPISISSTDVSYIVPSN